VAVLANDGSVLWTTDRSGTYVTVVGDGSGGRQLVFSDIGTVAAVDGATGRTRWNRSPELDIRLEDAADVNGDGTAEVFLGLSNGTVVSVDADTGEREWKTRVVSGETTVLTPPVLGDVTGDGTPEVIVGSRDGTVAVLDAESGAELGAFEREVQVWTSPTPADIDGDDRAEILVEYGDGRVVALAFGQ
jgi:outer membrane protein assembly factor BamB